MPASLPSVIANLVRSLGANQRWPSHFLNALCAALSSSSNGTSAAGWITRTVLVSATTGLPQNGHEAACTLGSKVNSAAQAPHFTVRFSSTAAVLSMWDRPASRSCSSMRVQGRFGIGFSNPQ